MTTTTTTGKVFISNCICIACDDCTVCALSSVYPAGVRCVTFYQLKSATMNISITILERFPNWVINVEIHLKRVMQSNFPSNEMRWDAFGGSFGSITLPFSLDWSLHFNRWFAFSSKQKVWWMNPDFVYRNGSRRQLPKKTHTYTIRTIHLFLFSVSNQFNSFWHSAQCNSFEISWNVIFLVNFIERKIAEGDSRRFRRKEFLLLRFWQGFCHCL